MQLKSSLISFNHHFDSPVIPTNKKKELRNQFLLSFLFVQDVSPCLSRIPDAHCLPSWRQHDVLHVVSLFEQRGNLVIGEASDAATYAGDEEGEGGVLLGKRDELINIGFDGLYAALHRGYGIALPLQSHALSHDSSKLAVGDVGRASAMHTTKITAKHEDLVWLE